MKKILIFLSMIFACSISQKITAMEYLCEEFNHLSLEQKPDALPAELVIHILCDVFDEKNIPAKSLFNRLVTIMTVCKAWGNLILDDNAKVYALLLTYVFNHNLEPLALEEAKKSFDYQSIATWCDGTFPLHFVAAQGREDLAKYYMRLNKALVTLVDQYGCTALHYAAARGKVAVVKLLLGCNDNDVNALDCNKMTPLMCAQMAHKAEVVLLLMDHSNVDATTVCNYDFQGKLFDDVSLDTDPMNLSEQIKRAVIDHVRLKKYVTKSSSKSNLLNNG